MKKQQRLSSIFVYPLFFLLLMITVLPQKYISTKCRYSNIRTIEKTAAIEANCLNLVGHILFEIK